MNFLPQQDQILIKGGCRQKFFAVAAVAALLFAVLSILFFALFYMYVKDKNALLAREIETLNKNPVFAEFLETQNSLKKINEEINFLSQKENEMFSITPIIEKIIKQKEQLADISIEYIVLEKISGGTAKAVARGTAASRDELLNYFENLKKENAFSKVELPTENILKNKNIDYTINIFLR